MSDNLIPINTMGYYDEETKQWVPVDSMAVKSQTNRVTADEIVNNFSSIKSDLSSVTNNFNKISNKLSSVSSDLSSVRNDFDEFYKAETTFDFTTISPVYYTTLNLAGTSVVQCFVIDELTGDIYGTQVASVNQDKSQSFTITRMNQNGVMLDSMTLVHGGHGTTIGLEREGGKVYVWSNYDVVDSNGNTVGNDLVRFPYVAGATLTQDSSYIKRYNKFNNYYTIPVIDRENGFIAFRIRLKDDNSLVELRKLSDVKNGVNKVLGKVIIPSDLFYLQGFTIDGYDLYWYTGDTNNQTYPCELALFSFIDGKLKKRISCDFGYGPTGKYEDSFREPEAVFLYKDPNTRKKSLFAGVVTGGVGKRINKVYAYHSKENATKFTADLSQGYQGYALTRNNGNANGLPEGLSNLKDFRKVGSYYMSTVDTVNYKDHPSPGDAGWWLQIEPADPHGTVVQTLKRNSTGRDIKIYTRVVTNNGVTGDWVEIMSSQSLVWNDLALRNGASNPDSGDKLQFAINGGLVHIRGKVTIPLTDGVIFAILPSGARPKRSHYAAYEVAGTTGTRKIGIRSNGEMVAMGLMANGRENATYTYVNTSFPLN